MTKINRVDNIVLNLVSGFKPQQLTSDEVSLLKEHFGEDWFEDMGYDEYPEYHKPTFDNG